MENNRRVVITGIGPFTSLGIGKEELWSNLLKGKIAVSPIPEKFKKNYSFRTKYYVPFPEYSFNDFDLSSRYTSLMEESSKVSLIGTKLALDDAGLMGKENTIEHYDPETINIIIGVGIVCLQTIFDSYLVHNFEDRQDILNTLDLKPLYNRMVIPSVMPNSASGWISIIYGVKGSNYTVNTACSSGSYAIGEAFRKIRDGYAEMLITGGAECLKEKSGAVIRGFDMLDTLTKSSDGRPQPFSYDRSGFLFSEGGACIIILEEYHKAVKRGARIYAEILSYEANSDAYNIIQIEPGGKQIKNLLNKITGGLHIDYM